MLNSFVVNYLIRQRVSTHVTVTIVEQLPVLKPSRQSYLFHQIAKLRRLRSDQGASVATGVTRLQALVAVLYELTAHELGHMLATFPLMDTDEKEAVMRKFRTVAQLARY